MAQSGGRPQSQPVAAANVLDGFLSFNSGSAAVTVITVPAGRTWIGTVSVSASTSVPAASTSPGETTALVSIAGAGAVPPAGNIFEVTTTAGANAAGGTVGSQSSNNGSTPLQVVAPAGNSVAVQVAVTAGATTSKASCTFVGALQ